ncbi:DNA polymerase Y family protein [uncultured Paraglaciecola sp.]|uniref:Y-family DNA polymerase n=1 Tax=uncultured Paraglaciecola sp. TaxID=1765024 RepID=UPI0030D78A40|tara:strand:+ start:2345 stop:3754 length:1410 start_codon:yes stop_codon:yes gene_type:complete
MHSLWLYLHFPNLQLDSYALEERAITSPLIILDSTNNIVQLNQAARDLGIKMQMSLGTAAALHRNLQVVPFNPKIEQQQLSLIAQNLYLTVSDISFFSPQGLLLKVHNMLGLYGDLSTLWGMIRKQLASHHVHFSYASGHSPLAAKLLAVKGWNKVTCKHEEIRGALKHINLVFTDLTSKEIGKLNSVGIKTVEQLFSVPFSDLAKRFDTQVITYLGQLRGDFKHPVDFFHPKEHFQQYIELLYEIERSDVLLRPIQHLLTSLENFLLQRDELTQQLHLTLYQRDKTPLNVNIGSQQGEYRARNWSALLTLKFESLILNAPIVALQLATGKTFVRSPDKQDLFLGRQGAVSRLQLVSLLSAKLGENVLFSPGTMNDYRPECASKYTPPLEVKESAPLYHSSLRPSLLLPVPIILSEVVSIMHGPERISTGWWDHHAVVRDYFIAMSQNGQWFWIFRTPEKQWFLHGIFS